MTRYRLILTYLIAGLLLVALGDRFWLAIQQVREAARPQAMRATKGVDLDIINFTLQAKALVGALESLKAKQPSFSSGIPGDQPPPWVRQFADSWLQHDDRQPQLLGKARPSPGLLQRQYILANHLGMQDQARKIWLVLNSRFPNLSASEKRLNLLLAKNDDQALRPGKTPTPLEKRFIQSKLDWFGELFLADTARAGEKRPFSQSPAYAQAMRAYGRIMLATAFFSLLGLLGLLTMIIAFWLLKTKRPAFYLTDVPGGYFLEIFSLYLGGMFLLEIAGLKALPVLLPRLSGFGRLLLLNIGGISALLLMLFWPVLFNIPVRSIFRALGLSGTTLRNLLADAGLGLLGFAAAMPLVAIALVINFYLLASLGLDMRAGMHPLIPVLLKTKDPVTLALALFLAAGIAPVVEEIMFRGALFTWLRGRMRAWAAILLSATVFAAIHPQGVFGFLPILVIGCGLALLREWRHRLWPSMLMHACVNACTFLLAVTLFRE